ncbi:MAG: Mrp/NBP35 family ATP-binding protein [Lachnospiraceae bacterium]|nr:Mrp/NBP35 family ATP-binding protein [Lachnospiraceae bacterium]MEE3437776.1 Mrp/NBP35 family ATP-binding protein [Lachnospiraceae bacterium]
MAENYTKKAGDIKPPKQKAPQPVKDPNDFSEPMNAGSNVKKVIGVVSGKGGVGKSLVTGLLAIAAKRAGKKVGILDADVTGPSIPKMFGVHEKAMSDGVNIIPAVSEGGIEMMSTNLILDDEKEPVIWRGPVIAGVVKQFWGEVLWGDVDVLFVDMPPGTGDVPLTVFQSLPVDGIVIVTSPQDLVSMIVEKAARMAEMMKIPVLGIVENMSYITCPDCGRRIYPFGEGRVEAVAADHSLNLIARMPIEPYIAALCDAGKIEAVPDDKLEELKAFI